MKFQKKFLFFLVVLLFISIQQAYALNIMGPREVDNTRYNEVIVGNLSFLFPKEIVQNDTDISKNYILSINKNGTKNNLNITSLKEKYTKEELLEPIISNENYQVNEIDLDLPNGWDYVSYKLIDNCNFAQFWTNFGKNTYVFSMISSVDDFEDNLKVVTEIIKTTALA